MSGSRIIEFVGPTSSGKTTYVARLIKESSELGIPVVIAEEAVLGRLSRFLGWRRLRSVCVDLIVATRYLGSVLRCRSVLGQIGSAAMQRQDSLLMRLNLTRNAVKRLAIFDHLQRVEIQKIVIFDEGPLQACMNAFVHYEDGVNEERLIEVAAALPVPATVVVMSASSEEVIARSVTRVDKAFKGLLDHHWAAIKSTFESVLPRVIAENTNIDRVVRIASDNPLSAREFWQEVGCLGVSAHTTAK